MAQAWSTRLSKTQLNTWIQSLTQLQSLSKSQTINTNININMTHHHFNVRPFSAAAGGEHGHGDAHGDAHGEHGEFHDHIHRFPQYPLPNAPVC